MRKGKPALILVSWFMLIAGLFITGSIRTLISKIASGINSGLGPISASLLGVGVPTVMWVLALLILLELWHTMLGKGGKKLGKGKSGKPSIITPILALLAPTLLIAGGTIFGDGVQKIVQLATGWL